MSSTHNSTTHHYHNKYNPHHHHDSSKKILKEMPHKLHDTPPYSDIFFNGNGFERFSNQPQTNTRVSNYYDHKHKYGFMQKEEDINAQAADFIESRHKKFELSKTMSVMGD
ncbi:hypothetical protein L1987_11307 [Smallanthus sonchifolius]|uniref:Uncharacterized protein n=1 Tax=Smallanthus sonchifolius TaxID=185202 RepID=A0ACB9JB52_9ASTR|nr:hypothetical protein L1987_11307 [Smallanthus sonchifolius]